MGREGHGDTQLFVALHVDLICGIYMEGRQSHRCYPSYTYPKQKEPPMPITQERFISLLEIIDKTKVNFDLFRAFAEKQRAVFNQTTDREKLAELYEQLFSAALSVCSFEQNDFYTFARERAHFLANANRNKINRDRAKRFRLGEKTRRETAEAEREIEQFFPARGETKNGETRDKEAETEKTEKTQTLNLSPEEIHKELLSLQKTLSEPIVTGDIRDLILKLGGTEGDLESWLIQLKTLPWAKDGRYKGEILILDEGMDERD